MKHSIKKLPADGLAIVLLLILTCCGKTEKFNGTYTGLSLDHVAFPLGGLGAGMICVEGTGALSQASLFHHPDLFRRLAGYRRENG